MSNGAFFRNLIRLAARVPKYLKRPIDRPAKPLLPLRQQCPWRCIEQSMASHRYAILRASIPGRAPKILLARPAILSRNGAGYDSGGDSDTQSSTQQPPRATRWIMAAGRAEVPSRDEVQTACLPGAPQSSADRSSVAHPKCAWEFQQRRLPGCAEIAYRQVACRPGSSLGPLASYAAIPAALHARHPAL
jgi:hypothetical protein